jgi:osmoprotectant transport system permease protein
VLLAILFGVGFSMAVVALVVYATLPVLRNTMVGIQHVDRAVVDAGRGMGMSARQVLLGIELPLAVPVMLAGIRVALILNVGVATLATYTNAGGLGSLIESGIVFNRTPVLLAGSVLVVALALLVDWIAGLVEHVFRPRGL